MKYMKAVSIIFGITMSGELLNRVLPFPVPSGVYGFVLLLAVLCAGIVKVEDIEHTGNFLLDTMPIMFIPVSVGLIESFDAVKAVFVPFLAVCAVSTIAVMVVTGLTAEWMIKRQKKGEQ